MLRKRDGLALQLLVQRASIVPEQLHIVKLAKLITAQLDEIILIKRQSLTSQVKQVSEVVARIEGQPRDSQRVPKQVALLEQLLKAFQLDSILRMLIEVDSR